MIPFKHPLTPEAIEQLDLQSARKILHLTIAQLKFMHEINQEKAELIEYLQREILNANQNIVRH